MSSEMTITRQTLLLAPLAACVTASGAANAPAWLSDFVDIFYRRKDVRTAFERYVAEDYIQHSEGIGQGREAAIAALSPMFARPQFQLDPIRVMHDGSLATVFVRVAVGAEVSALVIDIFRIDQQRIVEHWDIKREIPPAEADAFFANLDSRV